MNLSLSFIRGMLAAVNPCGFVLLPTYLLYFLGLSNAESGVRKAPVRRALVVSAAVSAGFLSVFLVVGAIADRIAVLRNGRLVELGDADSLLADPADDYTASLVALARR